MFNFKTNNFDLLRFLAALQVVISHSIGHISFSWGAKISHVLSYFPGVPIFFVISGFLISASYERNSNIKHYAWSRFLRIFPALWVCLLISILLAVIIGNISFTFIQFFPWFLSQISFLQIYNPDFLREFGAGVLNGSLWTIPIELQFYITLPLLYWITQKKNIDLKFIILTIFFGILYQCYLSLESIVNFSAFFKFLNFLLPIHLYLFLIGILIQRNYKNIQFFIEGRALQWFCIYCFSAVIFVTLGWSKTGNNLHIILATLLGITIIAFATTNPSLSKKLLGNNDISYGLYIYHMPIINSFVQIGAVNNLIYIIAIILLTSFLAFISWILIEQPVLKLKINPLHPSHDSTLLKNSRAVLQLSHRS